MEICLCVVVLTSDAKVGFAGSGVPEYLHQSKSNATLFFFFPSSPLHCKRASRARYATGCMIALELFNPLAGSAHFSLNFHFLFSGGR